MWYDVIIFDKLVCDAGEKMLRDTGRNVFGSNDARRTNAYSCAVSIRPNLMEAEIYTQGLRRRKA